MNILENIRLAWEGLKSNKMRALLTMLGIIIGISSVIAILTVGDGMSGQITSSMSTLGASNITISLQARNRNNTSSFSTAFGRVGGNPETKDLISQDMIDQFVDRFPEDIVGVGLNESAGSGQAQDGRKYANVSVIGTNTQFAEINNLELLRGRYLNQRDIDGYRNLCVVSDKLVSKMFEGDMSLALGQELKVNLSNEYHVFSIVGVYKYEQSALNMSFSSDEDLTTSLYIPVTTAKKMTGAESGYRSFTAMVAGETDPITFADTASNFFNRFYKNNADYQIAATSMESITEQINSIMDSVSIALSVIAGISLLVGGIGVMNIMLVSVTERTREIGTRKALGATNNNIRLQFVVESTIVCLFGGFIGVILGGIMGYFGSSLLGESVFPSVSSILLATGFSIGIGVFFGYYPANKAAKLDPIEALRYE